MATDDVLESIIEWGTKSEHVQALIQTGSLARKDGSADDLSDLDVEIIMANPTILMANSAWLGEIGDLITVLPLDPEDGQEWASRLAIYAGGVKVDFTLAGIERLRSMATERTLDPLYDRGYRVLIDKAGLTEHLPDPSRGFPVQPLPSQEMFRAAVEEFWFEAFHVPKYLARGELWLVKQRDWTMKELLLRMLEWHALARNSDRIDIWHIGTRLRDWTDAETWKQLQGTFGQFDAADARRAFEATAELYGRLGREVARIVGLEYPQRVEDEIMAISAAIMSRKS
jgi:aminoglycoside 6-adenylyltransferase